ncbi:MAG: tape measure protein, partial [Gammaproteobacteria bacterium]
MAENDVSIIIRVNDSEAEKLRKVAAAGKQLDDAMKGASVSMRQLDQAQKSAAATNDAVQASIQRQLAAMRQRNALIGATTELERVERQIRLGNYAAHNAAQLTELRNLAAQYDAQMRLLNVERQRASARSGVGNFATGALSYAGVGFCANALGGGIAVAGSTYFASRTAIEFERAEQAILATTGSLVEAERQMADVEVQARRLGINITDLARLWARFQAASQGTSLEGERARDIFLAVAEAAQRLSLRADEVQGILRAVEQMMSKGKIQAEELRGQLGDRLP